MKFNIKRLLICFSFVFIILDTSYGQNIKTAVGEASQKQEHNMSMEEARNLVIGQAKVNAIENAFGSYIEQDIRTEMKEGQMNFDMIGNVKVKGEWIETLQQPKIEFITRYAQNADGEKIPETWLNCKIKGKVREIVANPAEFELLPLNRPDRSAISESFVNGDNIYLLFRSAIEGYLSIYFEFDGSAYRILPYSAMQEPYLNAVPVEADKEYMFFYPNNNCDYFEGFSYYDVDEMQLGTEKDIEYNTIYTVFSKSPFTKPVLNDIEKRPDGLILPKSIDQQIFDTWLRKNSAADREFQFKKFRIQISNH